MLLPAGTFVYLLCRTDQAEWEKKVLATWALPGFAPGVAANFGAGSFSQSAGRPGALRVITSKVPGKFS